MTTPQYANDLEKWFYCTPSIVQEVLQQPFTAMNETLKAATGNPDELVEAGQRSTEIAHVLSHISEEHSRQAENVSRGWGGQAYDTFDTRNKEFTDGIDRAAELISRIEELLRSGAEAAMEGADLICQIIAELIKWAVMTLVANAALALLTFGASLAAAAAEVAAEAAAAVARVASVVQELSALLMRLEKVLLRVEKSLKNVGDMFTRLKETLTVLKAAKAAEGAVVGAGEIAEKTRGWGDVMHDAKEWKERVDTAHEIYEMGEKVTTMAGAVDEAEDLADR